MAMNRAFQFAGVIAADVPVVLFSTLNTAALDE